jgi:dipeptidyl aminopeptidase/acylaminoacyl peptidase
VRQLTDGEFDVNTAVWSPDGKRITMLSNLDKDSDVPPAFNFRNIYILSPGGGEPELLWEGASWDIGTSWFGPSLIWSPDGKYLAFTGRVMGDLGHDIYKNIDLWVIPAEGGEPMNLIAAFDRTIRTYPGGPVWSSDSKTLYFLAPDRGAVNIYKVGLDTREVEPITEGKMTVGSFNVDKTGSTIAFNATDALTPSELWIKDKKSMRPVTEINKGLLKNLRLTEPEEFWLTTSEGVEVQGWIIKPYDFKEGKKYPMILGVHGGPHGMYGYVGLSEVEEEAQQGGGHVEAVVHE